MGVGVNSGSLGFMVGVGGHGGCLGQVGLWC